MELIAAENVWIVTVQQMAFPDEIAALGKSIELFKAQLLQLHPFLDEEGLLSVGGRTQQAMVPYKKRHPFIMQSKHCLTKMLIEYAQTRLLHAALLPWQFAIVGT